MMGEMVSRNKFSGARGRKTLQEDRDQAVAHEYAVRLALIAFATAAVQGVISGAPFEATLKSALFVLAAFYVLGYVCGEMGRRIVEETVATMSAQTAPAVSNTPVVTNAPSR